MSLFHNWMYSLAVGLALLAAVGGLIGFFDYEVSAGLNEEGLTIPLEVIDRIRELPPLPPRQTALDLVVEAREESAADSLVSEVPEAISTTSDLVLTATTSEAAGEEPTASGTASLVTEEILEAAEPATTTEEEPAAADAAETGEGVEEVEEVENNPHETPQ